MPKPTENAARLAKKFSKGADKCRQLAEDTTEAKTRSIYLGLAASYEGMAADMMVRSKSSIASRT